LSIIALYLEGNLLSRFKSINNKENTSFIVITTNKISLIKVISYFTMFSLLSSKYLDYIGWLNIFNLQDNNRNICSYLEEDLIIRKDFNRPRTIFDWDHLKNSYLEN
jgi:hypothetical protein